jgi:hypothetical protein
MTGGEAVLRIRMEYARYGKPAFLESVNAGAKIDRVTP